jgi:hypothetical protein
VGSGLLLALWSRGRRDCLGFWGLGLPLCSVSFCYVVLNEVLAVCHCLLRLDWWSLNEEELGLVVVRTRKLNVCF